MLIALLSKNDAHHLWAFNFFTENAHEQFCMSALTYAEVLVHPIRKKEIKKFIRDIEPLQLEIFPITFDDSIRFAEMRTTTSLRMPDAVVLNSAIQFGTAIATADDKLAQIAIGKKVRVFRP